MGETIGPETIWSIKIGSLPLKTVLYRVAIRIPMDRRSVSIEDMRAPILPVVIADECELSTPEVAGYLDKLVALNWLSICPESGELVKAYRFNYEKLKIEYLA